MSPDARGHCPAPSLQSEKPELSDVLRGRTHAPWTLSAFAQFLEQNYCSETLHFTIDVSAYQKAYQKTFVSAAAGDGASSQNLALATRWQTLLRKYIRPDAEEEINIPGAARDALLRHHDPPPPTALQPAYDMVVELMGGVFVQFAESIQLCHYDIPLCHDDSDSSSSPVAEPMPLPFYRRAGGDWSKSRVYKKIQFYRRMSSKPHVEEVKSSAESREGESKGSMERRDSHALRFLGKW